VEGRIPRVKLKAFKGYYEMQHAQEVGVMRQDIPHIAPPANLSDGGKVAIGRGETSD
jgi:hypothetical protein